ncbi:MAG: Na-translocating system protein MpsC family protein [Bacillota bacterium]
MDTSYFKHIMLSKTKKFFKDLFAKGPDDLSIRITDDIIILKFAGILRKVEQELVGGQADKTDLVSNYRKELFLSQKDIFINEIEELLGRQVTNFVLDLNICDNSAVGLIILDRPL